MTSEDSDILKLKSDNKHTPIFDNPSLDGCGNAGEYDLSIRKGRHRCQPLQFKKDLLGMSLAELQQLCAEEGMPKFAAKQICDWLYAKHVDSIEAMTNLSLRARARLSEIAYIGRTSPVSCQVSKDGTKKYLFEIENLQLKMENKHTPVFDHPSKEGTLPHQDNSQFPILNSQFPKCVEAVLIPDDDRATLCISCQIGCKMGCRFCVTGQQGFHGNLSASDILNQIFSIPESATLTNVVFMGMGEPMDNLDSVLRVTEVLTAPWGLGWSPKRITVSSVGIIPALRRFLDESQCHLAISLHNPFADERLSIMPMQKAYPIADIISLLRQYDWSGQRRISFEYTMLRDINDTPRHAAELVRMLKGLYCRVNLIRFHSSPNTPYRTSTSQTIATFQNHLNAHGITCTLRASRGEDIMAACGLLAGQKR